MPTTEKSAIRSLYADEDELDIHPAPSITHLHNTFVLPKSREIYLTEEILDETGSWFVRCVRWLETHGEFGRSFTDPIRVVLNTPGGDVESMFAIHDAIRSTPCPVQVIGIGNVCSAGVLLLACGDQRLVTENLVLMSHESHGSEEGLGFRASQDRMKFRKWQHNRWCELMARYTSDIEKDAGWWKRKTERQAEYWLLGGQAIVDAGLADFVIHGGCWDSGPMLRERLAVKRDFEAEFRREPLRNDDEEGEEG